MFKTKSILSVDPKNTINIYSNNVPTGIHFNTTTQQDIRIDRINNLPEPTVLLIYKGGFLGCDAVKNKVGWCRYNHASNTHWKLIPDKDRPGQFYIKTTRTRENGTEYLGAPNQDGKVFLYTTKNRFTRWTRINGKLLYVGEKFNTTEVNLVIARYNEDIEWVSAYNDIATVYNKGGPINNVSFKNLIILPNIGREGHTYLHHMETNYNRFSDRVIFCQGDPFLHNETILFGIDNYEQMREVQPLGLVYLRSWNTPPREIELSLTERSSFGLHSLVLKVDGNHRSNLFLDEGVERLHLVYQKEPEYDASLCLMEYFLKLAGIPFDRPFENVPYTFAALFSVSKQVLQNSLTADQYAKLNVALTKNDPQSGLHGFILERLWLYLFHYVKK